MSRIKKLKNKLASLLDEKIESEGLLKWSDDMMSKQKTKRPKWEEYQNIELKVLKKIQEEIILCREEIERESELLAVVEINHEHVKQLELY